MKGKSGIKNQNIPLKTMPVTLSDRHYAEATFVINNERVNRMH